MSQQPSVLVVAEVASDRTLRPISFEMVTAGQAVASLFGGSLTALIMGSGIGSAAQTMATTGVERVLVADDPDLDGLPSQPATTTVVQAAAGCDASAILIPGTTAGRDYAPRVAARLSVGLAADVIGFEIDEGVLIASRPLFGGRAQSSIRLPGTPAMASIRAGSFDKSDASRPGPEPEPLRVDFTPGDGRVTVLETAAKDAGPTDLAAAEVVVGGGRGLKEPGNFGVVEELADVLGGAVGATRAVVDAGWRPHHEQIGQTGRTVSPRLYLAVGVSGAVQHNVGMQGSEYVVAINRDPDAPIFKIAAFGIVGDLFEVVPAVTAELRERQGRS